MKRILVTCLLMFVSTVIYAEKIATLPEVMKPFYLAVGESRIFITENSIKIHIYEFDLQAGKISFLKTFGTKGQGPGEFTFIHRLKILKDRLSIPTQGKYAEFTLDGEFIKEKKVGVPVFKNKIISVTGNFVIGNYSPAGPGGRKDASMTVKLYDGGFNLLTDLKIFTFHVGNKPINPFNPGCTFNVYDNKIFVVTYDDQAVVEVFNKGGTLIKKIPLPLQKQKVSKAMLARRLKFFKEDLGRDPERWKMVEKMIFYPNYCPAIESGWVMNNRIYVRTFKRKGDQVEFIVYDLEGKKITNGFVHDTGPLYRGQLFSFINNQIIYLRLDDADEDWEIHIDKIGE